MKPRVRVKICGITRITDAIAAAEAGADAIGLVFYPPSPRAVNIKTAQAIIAALPPFVSRVGLFVNAAPTQIESTLEHVALDTLQFHGDESPADCERYGLPYLKAIRMRPELNPITLEQTLQTYASAAGLLLDSYQPGIPGGTGTTFAWNRVPRADHQRLIIAGGLKADNITTALQKAHPYAVDVSGGVEQAPGLKDPAKIAEFIQKVHAYVA